MSDAKTSPVITRPQDPELLAKLERKLVEYQKRAQEAQGTRHPESAYLTDYHYRDALFKSAVLREVLTKGEVKTYDLSLELAKQYEPLDMDRFNNACAVIAVYCGQLDEGLYGGTGLN
jgi:hypothetical protein